MMELEVALEKLFKIWFVKYKAGIKNRMFKDDWAEKYVFILHCCLMELVTL